LAGPGGSPKGWHWSRPGSSSSKRTAPLRNSCRLKGELSLLHGRPGAAGSAEIHFWQALDGAREYGALSWELRAATSLARLLLNQGRPADATACLQPIYDRFTEGFSTADLIAAKQLLDDLGLAEHR
jgi:predicted ATPase